ncbi:MAG: hypothetical protein JNL66_04915 [Alphaproteobacteria bacterium]|nr:hypothetical protein [Alphaproteobacteria bacterium]
MSDEADLAEFRRRAAARGLAFAEDDLLELHRGWQGLQPQLERLRRGLESPAPGDDPPA